MVGQAPAGLVEERYPLSCGLFEGRPIDDLDPGDVGELIDVLHEARAVDPHEAVGAERRQDLEAVLALLGRKQLVIGQVAHGVVRGAHTGHVHALDESLGGKLRRGEKRVGPLPDGLGVLAADGEVDVEEAAQLQVAPLVDGVAHRALHGVNEGQVLGVIVVAANHGLGRAVRAHEAPLVVIAEAVVVEPDLREVLVGAVRVDLGRHEMAVVIDDRHLLGVTVVKAARPLRGKKEVVVEEHGRYSPFSAETVASAPAALSSVSQTPLM